MNAWHLDDTMADRYLDGVLPMGLMASLESHVTGCEECRQKVTSRVTPQVTAKVAAVWEDVRDRVEAPPLPWAVGVLRRMGLGESSAVVLSAARSMSTAWTAATAVILAFAALAVMTDTVGGTALYLVIAPLVPVVGVAAAFGPTTDPLTEITRATPYPAARLVLLRAAGVTATSVPLAVAIGLLVPGSLLLAVGWLVPALAFVVTVLAASTWVDPRAAGAAVCAVWAGAVGAASGRTDTPLTLVETGVQPLYLALALAAALVLAARVRRANGGL
ncbi:zf-HC2 domain-containing protein [Actinocorallia sp. A-T 12471]|uniref:zf-HC2 domain-containing protein n=1 Tax=Actinocorallia sp. A-T 12471 TaxID=3089813 RepID=UPI0029D3E8C9|nr:zf-HC2 domain-containing protein [Actinocorallia sp. A-T 12471]MDX6738754.1 zf-HC2 domain-containing protein [Actinocorallia sp. A-T 12471]